jgi:hypothetical protein
LSLSRVVDRVLRVEYPVASEGVVVNERRSIIFRHGGAISTPRNKVGLMMIPGIAVAVPVVIASAARATTASAPAASALLYNGEIDDWDDDGDQ